MKKRMLAFACALGALAVAGPAGAGVSVGVNDDAGKYSDGAPQFWDVMKQNNLKQNAITVLWDETQPTAILDEGFIANALPVAAANGIKVVFDVYPMHSQAFTQNGATPAAFGSFVAKLQQRFPTVTEYVVMNECNQTRFVNPQFNASGVNQSAAICGQALAAAYDALKAASSSITVWGIGLSPRGNDNASAASNISTSPVNFLKALGAWYKASGRTKPIMDGFDFHPYPIPQSLPFATGYADLENAAVSNLPRIYQAFYDGFNGTAQPTIGQQSGGGLPVSLNEVGIQTDNTGKAGYTGTETSGDANGGVRGDTGTEAFQSGWYLQMLNYVACDPNVKVVNLFHLVDETALEGWQSGLFYAGYAPKASAAAVSSWIAQTSGNCTGSSKPWSPTSALDLSTLPVTKAAFTPLPSWALTFFTPPAFTWPPFNFAIFSPSSFLPTFNQLGPVLQDVDLTIRLLFLGTHATSSARGLSSAAATAKTKTVFSKTVRVKKGKKARAALSLTKAQQKKLKAGYYEVAFDLKAVKGKAKGTLTSPAFFLGAGGKIAKN
jgi:hypothetical protein